MQEPERLPGQREWSVTQLDVSHAPKQGPYLQNVVGQAHSIRKRAVIEPNAGRAYLTNSKPVINQAGVSSFLMWTPGLLETGAKF